jgi:hypothetical protein
MTGQVFFREVGMVQGKHAMMVIGIVAMPEGVVKSEHQYTVTGTEDLSMMTVHLHTATDRTEEMRGAGIGHAVIVPMWRI